MILVNKPRVSILKNFFVSLILAVLLNSFFISVVGAENFMVSSGTDNTTETSTPLSASDITKINYSDDSRFQNNSGSWPIGESYDENKYIEFIFAPNIPENAIINEVYLSNEFRRSGALLGAKLEVWDGDTFHDELLTTGTTNIDHTDITSNLSSYLDTVPKINNLKVRFLAYRGTGGNTKTSHDFLELAVNYTLPEEDPVFGPHTKVVGDITENTTWTKADSPYFVSSDISVGIGATLTIEEGTVVKFEQAGLFVDGVLKVLGTESEAVYFTSIYDDEILGDTNGDGEDNYPYNGDWNYISINKNPTKSVLNNLKIKYSDYGLILFEGGSVISDGLESNKGIEAFNSESSFVNLNIPSINIDGASAISIDKGIISNKDTSEFFGLNVSNGSSLVLKNADIFSENLSSNINIFKNSSVDFYKVNFSGVNTRSSSITVSYDSILKIKESILESDKDVITVFEDSSLEILDSELRCEDEGIVVFNDSNISFDTGSIICKKSAMVLFNEIKADINKVKISGTYNGGIVAFENTDPEAIHITRSEIFDNLYGFLIFDSTFNAHENNIHDNVFMGADTFSEIELDFKNNYWGDSTGPYHLDFNPDGLGDSIGEYILFYPWLSSWPPKEECVKDCFSNVMFFPGVQGSRLYGEVFDCDVVVPTDSRFCGEQQLWLSNNKILQEYMFLDEYGKSLNNIYTKNDTEVLDTDDGERGIIDSALGLGIYREFVNDLKNLKDEKAINDYALIPYDWRLSLEDIITNGKVSSQDLSYINSQDFSESFILNKLRELEKSSKSGKVTLIAHSTGGLVIKALVQKLKDTNDPLYEKIDKIIFVAVPQVGTPEATIAMLHGIPLGYGALMPSERSRQLGENMPTMYNLAPSLAYFDTVNGDQSPLITFPDHDLFRDQIEKYGNSINTKQELKDFVLGGDGRSKPKVDDTDKPNIVNSYLYEQAENIHEIIDSWQPSVNTKIIEVAGWGEETKAGLKYVVKKKLLGLGKEYISYKPIKVIDGDSTVVLPSALWMENNENVEEWLVNLFENNKNSFIGDDHKNILEILELRNFIKAQIQNIEFNDNQNIIIKNNLSLLSSEPRLHFTLHSPLTLGITDIEGRYTGLVPETGEIREEIPGVTYEQIGTVQFLSIPTGLLYTLKLVGYEEGSFTLDVEKQEGNNITEENYFEAIPTSSKTLAYLEIGTDFKVPEAKLKIDTDGDGDIDEVYPKVEVVEEIMPVASLHGVVILPKNNNIIPNTALTVLGNIGQVLGVDTTEITVQEITESENNQEKVLIKKENVEYKEIENILEEENKEEIPINVLKEKDTNKNTSFYVIILSILALSFIIKRFILI